MMIYWIKKKKKKKKKKECMNFHNYEYPEGIENVFVTYNAHSNYFFL